MNLEEKMMMTDPGFMAAWITDFIHDNSAVLEELHGSIEASISAVSQLEAIRNWLEARAIDELRVQKHDWLSENKWITELEDKR